METKFTDASGIVIPERREHPHLRAIYDEAAEQLQHLFKSRDDWAGSSIDYAALRLVHERYGELSSDEVRILVGAIGRRTQHCTSQARLTALYP